MADGSVKFDTKIDSSGLRSGLAGLGKVALAGTAAAATAIATLGTAAVKAGIDFESAFAGVKKTVDATSEQFETLRKDILDMSKEIPLAATEIAGIAEAAGQLGIKTEAISEFTRVMADLGVATNMTSEQAATELARLANITQMPQDKFDELGSTIVALGNNFATTESEISSMALRLAGTGKQVGLTEAEILSMAAAASSVGLAAEVGGSAFSRVFTMMQLACEEGGDALQGFADIAGMSGSEFKRAFQDDASGALVSFVEGLGKAEEQGKSAIGMINELGSVQGYSTIKSIAVRDALLRASGASVVFTEALKVGTEAWNENNALTKEAEQRYQTLESRLVMMKNSASSLGIAVYESLKEPLGEVVSFATGAMQQLEDAFNSGGFEGLISELGSVLGTAVTEIANAAPGFVSAALGLIENFVTTIISNSGTIIDAVLEVGVLLAESLITLAPQLLTAAVEILYQLATGIVEALPELFAAIVEALPQIVTFIAEILPTLIEQLVAAITEALPLLIEQIPILLEQIINGIIQAFPALLGVVSQAIVAIIELLPSLIQTLVSALPSLIQTIVQGILGNLPLLIQCVIDIVMALVDALPDIIQSILEILPDLIETIVDSVLENLPVIIDCVIQLIQAIVDSLPEIIQSIVEIIPDLINTIIDSILEAIPVLIECVIEIVMALIGELPTIIQLIVEELPQIVFAIIDTLLERLPDLIQGAIDLFMGILEAIPVIIKELIRAMPEIIKTIVSGLGKGLSQITEVGKNLVQGLWNGISNAAGWVLEKIKGFGQTILNGIKSFFGINSPSRVFRDIIGKNLMFGLAEGIEDETSTAVAAMGKAAKEVGDVEFEAGSIQFDDPDNLYDKVSGTVNSQIAITTTTKAAEANAHTVDDSDTNDDSESNKPQFVQNDIYIDGRKTARVLTPYVAKELEWEGK